MQKIILSSLALAATLSAQATPYTITSSCLGNVVYQRTSYPTSTTSTSGFANLRGGGATGADYLYQSRWYYRVAGDPGQSVYNNGATSGLQPQIISTKGDTAVLNWRNTDGRGFDSQLRQRVYSTGQNDGVLSECLTVRNPGTSPLVIDLYHYVDYDVAGSGGNDAQWVGVPRQMEVSHAATTTDKMYYLACGWQNFEVTGFATLRTSLGAAAPYNMANVGLPFVAGDFTGGYQWTNITVAPGGDVSVYVAHGFNRQIPCCDVATIENYCVAKPGTNGAPRWGDNPLYVCGTSELKILNGLPGSPPIVFVSGSRSCVPFAPFGTIAVLPVAANFNMPAFDGAGTSAACLQVPWNAGLCGVQIYMQAWFGDPGAVANLAHTDGACFTIGSL